MARLFFSYSHKDEALRDQLETHLAMLKRQGVIETWHDRRIMAGQALDHVISDNLEAADIVLLLVSPDFLASDYCYDREMARAMERHEQGLAVVVPVILRPSHWHDAPFGRLRAIPRDGKPVTQWPDLDAAFLDVTTEIKRLLAGRTVMPARPARIDILSTTQKIHVDARSSNLRVAKRFTERDKDRFLHESFEYIAKFFKNSLSELVKRNEGIDEQFRQLDANRFTAVAYRDGKATSRCTIFVGGEHFGGIGYSNNDNGATNSYNEHLTVESDDQSMFLRPMGMSRFTQGDNLKLTQQGAAEFLWENFIERLQRS